MRVVRKISDCSRYSADVISDLDVRTQIGVSAIDCIVAQNRLKYVGRVVANKVQPLVSLMLLCKQNRLRSTKTNKDTRTCTYTDTDTYTYRANYKRQRKCWSIISLGGLH